VLQINSTPERERDGIVMVTYLVTASRFWGFIHQRWGVYCYTISSTLKAAIIQGAETRGAY